LVALNNFSIRHYVPERDLPSLVRMLTEIESIDRDGEDTSEEYLRALLEWKNYRPNQDAWVAHAAGKLIGYAAAFEQPSQRCTLHAVVHPSQRRKGLGSQLLELTLSRAREVDSKTILIYANEHNSASNLFLKHHGFVPVGSSGAMKAPPSLVIPSFEFPSGFVLKRYSELNDPFILLSALNNCYLDMWGHQHNDKPTAEDIQSPRFLHYYDADDILLLFDPKNAVSGICSVRSNGKQDQNSSPSDLLDAPGVIKEYREMGYQRHLVLAGIQHLRKKGMNAITLEFYGDNENTLNIYHGIGFEMINFFLAYHRELV
jgi:mycothiol synthase